MRYIIIYTNARTVQGHRVYWSTSKLNIFSQGKVQGLTPTYPMQILTAKLYHHVESLFSLVVCQFSFMWGIVGKWFVKPCSRTILMLKFEWDPMCNSNGSWWICVLRCEEIEIVYSYTQNGYRVNEKLMPKVCLLKWKNDGKNAMSHMVKEANIWVVYICLLN